MLRAGLAADLGQTRLPRKPNLRIFLRRCTDQHLDQSPAVWVDIERYLR